MIFYAVSWKNLISKPILPYHRPAYVERNYIMIDSSDICVVYYNEDYQPPKRKNSRRDISPYQPKSGTRIAYEYAQKKKKDIVNIFC